MSSPAQEDVFHFIFLIFFLCISSLLLWNKKLIPYEIHISDVEEIV